MALRTEGICAFTVFLVTITAAAAASADGRWVVAADGRGIQMQPVTFEFKTEGDKLTGTVSAGTSGKVEIRDGKVNGDKITFQVLRTARERKVVFVYEGTVSANEIRFLQSVEGAGRNAREFIAKRQ